MSNDEYTQRLAADFKSQRVITSYPSEVYGVRRSFVPPVLSDFSLDSTTYCRCREEFLAREQVSATSDGIIVSVTSIIGAVSGGCYSFGAGLLGFFIGLFVGSALISGKSGATPSQDVLNANKYDQAVAEYKQAVEYKKQFEDENERNERRQRERERQLQVRLERQKQEDYWLNLNPYQFEEEVALCLKHGRVVDEAQVTKKSGDDGVDIWAQKGRQKIIIQCKAYAAPVGIKDIRELLGVKIHLKVPRAILVSRSTFTRSVHDFAHDNGLELIGLDDLLRFGHPQPLAGTTPKDSAKAKTTLDTQTGMGRIIIPESVMESPEPNIMNDAFLKALTQYDSRLLSWKEKKNNETTPLKAEQKKLLEKKGFQPEGWESVYADLVIEIINERKASGLATPKQVKLLLKKGYPNALEMGLEEANKIINAPADINVEDQRYYLSYKEPGSVRLNHY